MQPDLLIQNRSAILLAQKKESKLVRTGDLTSSEDFIIFFWGTFVKIQILTKIFL